ncbi:MAG: Stp1/IreP family PP2C-type Ser/Thr phosphatase [Lachnospiraceae bacterium]|nr:Stp1/IreP family PP2C-type Ser/Thr phosphatase [Lachnospiraceae bacterium]MCI9590086.1 Stp1/IreP family PP2C-type Ser/Thr phosphatase [Lachnospiraceae bacterium]MDE6929264.1 Stp1/IreP family PP2C-type Ser/Thr phosphatase [Lachnospiraceae bacterium]
MQISAYTDTGKVRSTNQDYIYASSQKTGPLKNLLLLADGMGGANAGDYASRFLVEKLVTYINRQPEGESEISIFNKGITEVNRRLYNESLCNESLKGMGTTMVAATVSKNILYVANVGDSRLYLIRGGLIQVTRDHSYVEEMVSLGLLNRESQDYRDKKNYITRAIGADGQVEIDFFEVSLHSGDQILLCSDGLSNMVSDKEIYSIVSGKGSLSEKAWQLLQTANDKGGKDNISVILAEPLESEGMSC